MSDGNFVAFTEDRSYDTSIDSQGKAYTPEEARDKLKSIFEYVLIDPQVKIEGDDHGGVVKFMTT